MTIRSRDMVINELHHIEELRNTIAETRVALRRYTDIANEHLESAIEEIDYLILADDEQEQPA